MILFTLLLVLSGCSSLFGVVNRVTDPDNMIHDYEWFHTASTHIESRAAQISSTKEILASTVNEIELTNLRIELAGQKQSCRELVADYDANAMMVTFGSFKGWSLPERFEPTICE